MPKIHVIIPAYNSERFIEEALRSITAQTYEDFVVTVVDDCSTDRTAEIARSLGDDRIRVVVNERNLGLPGSVNGQLNAVDCDFVARMDADDVAFPERFALQIEYLEANTDVDVLGTSALKISDTGTITGSYSERGYPLTHAEIKGNLIFGAPMLHPSVFFRWASFKDHGPIFRTIGVPAADYDAWVALVMAGYRFANLPQKLLKYRVHDEQISSAKSEAQKLIGDSLRYYVLQHVVPELTAKDWDTHDAIRSRRWKDLKFNDVTAWFSYLIESNRQSRWTDDDAMKQILERRLRVLIARTKYWPTAQKKAYEQAADKLFQ